MTNEPRSFSFSPFFHVHVLFWMQTEEQKNGGRPGNMASPGTQVWILWAGGSAVIARVGLQVGSCWRMTCTEQNNWDTCYRFHITLSNITVYNFIGYTKFKNLPKDQDLCHQTLSSLDTRRNSTWITEVDVLVSSRPSWAFQKFFIHLQAEEDHHDHQYSKFLS